MKQKFSLHGEQVVDNIEISDFNKVGEHVTFRDVTINDSPAILVMMARKDGFCLRIITEGKRATPKTDVYCIGDELTVEIDECDGMGKKKKRLPMCKSDKRKIMKEVKK